MSREEDVQKIVRVGDQIRMNTPVLSNEDGHGPVRTTEPGRVSKIIAGRFLDVPSNPPGYHIVSPSEVDPRDLERLKEQRFREQDGKKDIKSIRMKYQKKSSPPIKRGAAVRVIYPQNASGGNINAPAIVERGTYAGRTKRGRDQVHMEGVDDGDVPMIYEHPVVVEPEDDEPLTREELGESHQAALRNQPKQQKSIPVYLLLSRDGKGFDLRAVVPSSEGKNKSLLHGPYKSYEGAVELHHAWGRSLQKMFPSYGLAVLTDIGDGGKSLGGLMLVHHEKALDEDKTDLIRKGGKRPEAGKTAHGAPPTGRPVAARQSGARPTYPARPTEKVIYGEPSLLPAYVPPRYSPSEDVFLPEDYAPYEGEDFTDKKSIKALRLKYRR